MNQTTVMSPRFRPMLAAKIRSMSELHRYPYIASPKIDGIRCITRVKEQHDMFYDSKVEAVSRTLKAIPNWHVQKLIGAANLLGLDGELVTFTNGIMDKYNDVQSKIMTEVGEPDFKFMVFDVVTEETYVERLMQLYQAVTFPINAPFVKVPSLLIHDEAQLNAYEEKCIQEGYEGVMLRRSDGPYKFGRSTFKESYLLKVKRFLDSEAIVVGFEELMHNENIQTIGELGLAKRSDHLANMVPGGTLGALKVEKLEGTTVLKFNIGTGFDQRTRQDIWDNRKAYLGKTVKFKHQPYGAKEAPRCPVFIGFRNSIDS